MTSPEPGCRGGMVTDYTLEGAVADLVGVVEATGGAPVSLLAMSAAGPCAVVTAARRPDLVRDLVLFGTFADPTVAFPDPAFSRAMVEVVRARWGRGTAMVAQLFRPGVSDAAAERLGAVLRESADPATGTAYLAATFTSDAGPVLSSVHQPALVIHYRGDKVVPFAGGEHLALIAAQGALPATRRRLPPTRCRRCRPARPGGAGLPRRRRALTASAGHDSATAATRQVDTAASSMSTAIPITRAERPNASPGGTPGSSTPSTG